MEEGSEKCLLLAWKMKEGRHEPRNAAAFKLPYIKYIIIN